MILNRIMSSAIVLLLLTAGPAPAGNATIPGEITVPYPTITNLAVEWRIDGDDNLDSSVTVRYRRAGQSRWRTATPLFRVPGGGNTLMTSGGKEMTFPWDNKHSGSIFDLRPDSEYEIELTLTDPDGGSAKKTVRGKTRPVPRPAPNATVKPANPRTFKTVMAGAVPGDIIELTPGYYYDFEAVTDGEAGKPIVIRSDGGSAFDALSLRGRSHVHIEGFTVFDGIDLLGGKHLTVRRCTVTARYGITATSPPGAENCYIADNTVTYVMPWEAVGMGSGHVHGGAANLGEGIQITGPGNVICHNYVKGYRDCISTMEGPGVHNQVCIDIYNNDIYVGADDAIEADFCSHNCRIMRNRITNCCMGLSSQPGLGGPNYFIRNVMYNIVLSPYKLQRGSVGDVIIHNTTVKVGDGLACRTETAWSRAYFRNNLSIGGVGGGVYGRYSNGTGMAVFFPGADQTCDLDYDAVGTYLTPFAGQIGDIKFETIEEMKKLTTEKHAVQVDMTVFNGVPFPYPPVPEREPPDLRPVPGSTVVDSGFPLANINDGFKGSAPDIGAYEAGQELPLYGPRPKGVDEATTWREKN
ncbi:right-handed parallel beta-helix repeat-containing protein [candidate division KSB1 bacterium]